MHGDHGCQDSPESIREISRILYLHLKEYAAAAPVSGRAGGRSEACTYRDVFIATTELVLRYLSRTLPESRLRE